MSIFTSSPPGGNWNSSLTWGGFIPAYFFSDNIQIASNSTVTVTGNLAVNGSGLTTVYGELQDPAGGPKFNYNSSTSSSLDIYNLFSIEGTFIVNNTARVYVHNCGLLKTGSMTFMNNTSLMVDSCATVNITGNLTLTNNLSSIVHGTINVTGDVLVDNNATVIGTGTVTAGGSITINNSGMLFDWSVSNCPDNPTPCIATMSGFGLLPIELIDFNANLEDKKIHLQWTTASETDNNFFTVERSFDAVNFDEISTIDSKAENGNSIYNLEYYFDDLNIPNAEVVYYRLKQTDSFGKSSFSKIISVILSESEAFSIFPNPTNGPLYFRSRLPVNNKTVAEISIISTFGEEVFKRVFYTNSEFLESEIDLQEGNYIVTFRYRNKEISKPLIVKK